MSKARVYFDDDTLPVLENILDQTGLKSYTIVVHSLIKKYGKDFIRSYNEFLSDSDTPQPQIQIGKVIDLKSLESFNNE